MAHWQSQRLLEGHGLVQVDHQVKLFGLGLPGECKDGAQWERQVVGPDSVSGTLLHHEPAPRPQACLSLLRVLLCDVERALLPRSGATPGEWAGSTCPRWSSS